MNKEEFLAGLEKGLSGLPREDVTERLSFYAEMIDDRVEEGASEEEAVAGIGTVDETVSQILADTPLSKIVREKIAPKRSLRGWEIALLILGFPLWFPLVCAAGAVVLSMYIVVWALIVSLWAVELSFIAGALGSFGAAAMYFAGGGLFAGLAMLGAGLICAGISIFLFFGCLGATKGTAKLTEKATIGVKRAIAGKETSK